jgi:hypothetical protein
VFLEMDITLVLLNVEFHTVSSAPNLYRLDVRLREWAVLRRFDGAEDVDVLSERRQWE